MSGTVNTRIQFKRDTTQHWNEARGFIPLAGEIIVYIDYKIIEKEVNGELRNLYIPAIKIGDGRTYIQDLPFADTELRDKLMEHIDNSNIHVTTQEKLFWNNKLNVNDDMELVDGALVLNRNQKGDNTI